MRTRIIALVVAAVASVSVVAGTASAAPADLNAPYARAAARVAANGTLLATKNVASVERFNGQPTGYYCVRVSDATIDLRNAAVVATVNNFRAMITAIPNSNCNGQTRTITVVTSNYNNDLADVPFTVAVL
ncbi:hypothetical protein EES41_36805 (plasmid) [Streptomyces sp. ADI95-16]|uniref:hypothetical protein n=1 Tax=Streptomyces sp. ADI95-16 TaxID=1522758 RepID=UPI000F3A90A7|nr:hypothetical protein [Streptomyces sp. ADI95-16]AYV32322.1 hypothetical protein EES41_36805 [Streptomyces sp. ADI95-16]